MSFPKRPKGEKSSTTIRWQHRQMIQASKTIEVLRQRIDSFEKRDQRHFTEISGLETSLSVAQSQLERVQSEYAGFRAQSAERAERLAYLEGYYAKSTEPIATRLIE